MLSNETLKKYGEVVLRTTQEGMEWFVKTTSMLADLSIECTMDRAGVDKIEAIKILLNDRWGITVENLDEEIEKTRKNLEKQIFDHLKPSVKGDI